MKKTFKKLTSIILAAILLFAMSTVAFAAPGSGTPIGTKSEQIRFVNKAMEHYWEEANDTNEESWARWTRSTEDPNWIYWELEDGTIRIKNHNYPVEEEPKNIYNVTVPSTLDGKTVSEIRSVTDWDTLSVVIPDGITQLDYDVLANISDLKRVVIPASVTSIHVDAISNSGEYPYDIYFCGTEEQWNDIVVWNPLTWFDSEWAVTDFDWYGQVYAENEGVNYPTGVGTIYFNVDPATLEDLVPEEEPMTPFEEFINGIQTFFAKVVEFFKTIVSWFTFGQ